MRQIVRDLKRSFYNKKWEISADGNTAKTNRVTLWIGNGAYYFTGYGCAVNIPLSSRAYLFKHFRLAQGIKIKKPVECSTIQPNK